MLLQSSLRQAAVSFLLMSGVYVSNLLFNVSNRSSSKIVNDSESVDNDSFSILRYPISVLKSSNANGQTTLGACRLLADNPFSKIVEPYYNDQVFYSDSLGRHCRVKLNITIHHETVTIYETFAFKINHRYESFVVDEDSSNDLNVKELSVKDDEYDDYDDDSMMYHHYVEFINKTGIELSFNAHPYDDVAIADDERRGLVLYAIRNLETLYIIIIGERVKVYVVKYTTERALSRNYESHIFKVLRYEPDCSKYVHCTNHVKSVIK